jgi:pyruvate/2-oxoglutarate dehydrogenase complex dihydrolipoamide dehydrogenase (E3) component
VKLGSKIVVIGGGMVGCETADCVAGDGRQVIILEQLAQVAGDVEARTRKMLLQRLESHNVNILCNITVEAVENNTVVCAEKGIRLEIDGVDNVILAMGYRPNNFGQQTRSEKIHKIGDCVQPRNAINAVHEGFLLGATI